MGSAKQIVNADTIEIRQLVQGGYGDIQSAQFIIGIGCLMDIEENRDVFLTEISVLTQIPQTILIHNNHPGILCNKGYSLIAF